MLLVSEELEEILALSDRIVGLYGGKIIGQLLRSEAERRESRPPDARPEGGVMDAVALPTLSRAAGVAAPFVLAVAIGAIVLAATGHEPIGVYQLMASEAFGGERRIAATLTAATPLLLTGLAAAVAFRSGIFNVGAEGCFYLGGMVAAVLGFSLGDWPPILLIPVALAGAAHRRRPVADRTGRSARASWASTKSSRR